MTAESLTAERNTANRRAETAEQTLTDVRRYAEAMTSSLNVPVRDYAADLLDILDGAA